MPIICKLPTKSGVNVKNVTATKEDVLSGKKIIDSTKQEVVGTMPNNGAVSTTIGINGTYTIPKGYHDGTGKVTQTIPVITSNIYTPSASPQVITKGQYLSGDQTIKGDYNLIGANIKKGKTIFGIKGEVEEVNEIFNFPLTIQLDQPLPISNGHIWIKSDKSASFKNLLIVEAIKANAQDSSLMFVVGDLNNRTYSVAHTKTARDGNQMALSISDSNNNDRTWLVSSMSGKITQSVYFNKPMVYSKLDGVLDIETAFMWNGTDWITLGTKGSYLISVGDTGFSAYNKFGSELSVGSTISNQNSSNASGCLASVDGKYVVSGNSIYKRNGDVFEPYNTQESIIRDSNTYYYLSSAISGDGKTYVWVGSNSSIGHIYQVYTVKDTGLELFYEFKVSGTLYGVTLAINHDGSAFAASSYISYTSGYTSRLYYRDEEGKKYISSSFSPPMSGSYGTSVYTIYGIWFHGDYLYFAGEYGLDKDNLYATLSRGKLKFDTKTSVSCVTLIGYSYYNKNSLVFTKSGYTVSTLSGTVFFCGYGSYDALKLRIYVPDVGLLTGALPFTPTDTSSSTIWGGLSVSLNEDELFLVHKGTLYHFVLNINTQEKTYSLTTIKTYSLSNSKELFAVPR